MVKRRPYRTIHRGRCAICGDLFESKREDAEFCSARCRKRWARGWPKQYQCARQPVGWRRNPTPADQ